ncbi:hypothetical protein [Alteromonas sp. 14N.309.X.WAT.G.H12]|uniref:hypothetical protein n=1 Tax=Alteromonas sp. 14N.309.X.WAT.G.H12 TaxID=3120824 RepID=UPI002FD14D17
MKKENNYWLLVFHLLCASQQAISMANRLTCKYCRLMATESALALFPHPKILLLSHLPRLFDSNPEEQTYD